VTFNDTFAESSFTSTITNNPSIIFSEGNGFNTAQFGLPVVTVIPSSQPRDDDSCGETCIGITVGLVAFFGLLPLAGFLIYMFAIRGDEARIYRGKTGGMSGIEETLSAAQELREERKEASTGTDIY